ncbi:MAG: sulfotransferase family protein [Planctomycetota bacterium]
MSTGGAKDEIRGRKAAFWMPRFWSGMSTSGYFRMLGRNRFAVSPSRWSMASILSFISLNNSGWKLIQNSLRGRRIRETRLVGDPIFIIGHWRSGTTLLHELLVLDARFTCPDTYMAFAPNHFLVSGWLYRPTLSFLLPSERPMDGMAAGWDKPQEDEFALCNLGVPSPYLTIAFPNHPPQNREYLTLDRLPPTERDAWKERLDWFLRAVTVHCPKQIVLKSPPHTARLKILLEMYPKAKFVHIVRDPYVVFVSTMNLWRRLYADHGLQSPKFEGLREYVFETFLEMYEAFDRDRAILGEHQFSEVRYEELVANPIVEMQRVYDELQLGGFDDVLPALTKYFADKAEYKTNKYQLDPALEAEITQRWGDFIERYGYMRQAVRA